MSLLTQFPAGVQFTDKNGNLTKAAMAFFNSLYVRVGGALGPTITELTVIDDEDSGLEEFRLESIKALDALAMSPAATPDDRTTVEALQTELAGLREEVAVLRNLIDGIQQGPTL